jgi:hypothetical protein
VVVGGLDLSIIFLVKMIYWNYLISVAAEPPDLSDVLAEIEAMLYH